MTEFVKNSESWRFIQWDRGDSLSMNGLGDVALKSRRIFM